MFFMNFLFCRDLSLCRSICRLCLETSGKMEDLFFNESDEHLSEKIFQCTSVKVEKIAYFNKKNSLDRVC